MDGTMNHRKLMSEYYKDDGSVAKLYQVINGMDGEHSFFSITYKDAAGTRITTEDFKYKSTELQLLKEKFISLQS